MTICHMLVEGDLDEAVARRLIEYTGFQVGVCYGKHGWTYIKEKVQGFNKAAQSMRFLALVDFMDTGSQLCPGNVVGTWLPHRNSGMLFRVVVREIESWLMADPAGIAEFLNVAQEKVPDTPELLQDPKRALVNLARQSRTHRTRDAMVPNIGSSSQEGRLYTSEMIRFIGSRWDVSVARLNAPSLDKCLLRLETFDHREARLPL